MRRTIGIHWVKSAYGLWLPGDERGSWSSAWDDQIGYYEPHMLHPADPIRQRMAEERMKHPPVFFTDEMCQVVEHSIGQCAKSSPWKIAAASIERTHTHLAITASPLNIYQR